jgi:nitrite reductase/ring-hydroxylating ferredoxin subunit
MPRSPAPGRLRPLIEALEGAEGLDGVGKTLGKAIRGVIKPGVVKDALSGTWLGHALHPLMTDVVIGSFVSATLLDALGGEDDDEAAQKLIGVGLAAYGPTALAGLNDWADTEISDEAARRVGLVHAWTNAGAFTMYAASLAARRRGEHGRGRLLALAGAGTLGLGGFLGGHLSFAQGVGVNQTTFDPGPADWTEVDASGLEDGKPLGVLAGETPVVLVRHRGHVHAMHDRCSHRGCPLSKSKLDGEVIECFCHGSRFRLGDGTVERGPATAPQPVYEVRESDGKLEIRLA